MEGKSDDQEFVSAPRLLLDVLYCSRGRKDNTKRSDFVEMLQSPQHRLKDHLIDRKIGSFLEMIGTFYMGVNAVAEQDDPDEVSNWYCCRHLSFTQ